MDGVEDVALDTKKVKQYEWTKTLRRCKGDYSENGSTIGGEIYNITKMAREKRASYAFDKVDPLADISAKDLRERNLMVA